MKEKLTIDQKIQIARIAGDITCATMQPSQSIQETSARIRDDSEVQLFRQFYDAVLKTVMSEPENI
ncbi:hypothetical protein GFI10_26050 [Salmonella enterica subsp. diarizonae]|nr:hypothetical protein [Salmonella enterica subsp. diarizonae]ECN6292029.1 hypothetical protein [Salmonella enterica subsp. enterica serovar Typhimurium]ECQ1025112.1 hypothetical protein [Salmonella enterica subsp. diarizonae]ECY4883517.1 hypothetical protein [Salmonella enterica subsp. enterica serovar Typhimurium]EDJ8987534.1 hypothetical protein [Salmonella enterica subsp. diarizonae]